MVRALEVILVIFSPLVFCLTAQFLANDPQGSASSLLIPKLGKFISMAVIH